MPINLSELKIYNPYDVYLSSIKGDRFSYHQPNDKIKRLPENLQDLIFDPAPADFVKDRISIPFGLEESQSREIAKIILEIILADWYLGGIVSQISRKTGIEEPKAKIIAGLIITELLAPILEDLKKIHIEKFAKNTPRPEVQKNQSLSEDDRIIDLKNNL